MEDRYEIRGKIGQGGIGSVYRGYDMRMKREVAIKRILSSPDDPSLREEATKQLVVEAGALASLQHPHIVTVYDVGSDDDGPYVVMELINGKTLDEIIENAPLTWQDFRELAMQSQEALIAAQELDMIHSDLKPPNIMLTWLPSGKFQVKIVDFGLAVLTQNQSKEEIENMEAVFGSIFFMPPEQFERETLDVRSDLYSIGCVYYQALTGTYPFNGETGTEVMEAHLNHEVRPMQELRADIPIWACDWVMWLINRSREDRPQSARDALSNFLHNDKEPDPEMSRGSEQAKRPRLIIPGAIPSEPSTPENPGVTGVPLMPPDSTSSVQVRADQAAEEPKKSNTAPQALAPPGGKPSVHTGTAPTALPDNAPKAKTQSTPTAGTGPIAISRAPTSRVSTGPVSHTATQPVAGTAATAAEVAEVSKSKLSNSAKLVMAGVLALLVVLAGWMLMNRSKQNKRNQIYSTVMAQAMVDGAKEVPMNAKQLQILLETISSTGMVEDRDSIYLALILARSSDGTDIDMVIADFATTTEMMSDVRNKLIGMVLRERESVAIVPKMLEYAKTTNDVDASVAAYNAVRNTLNRDHAEDMLRVVVSSEHPAVRKAAETNLGEIIASSDSRVFLTKRIAKVYEDADKPEVRHALIRLMGRCSTPKALEQLKMSLNSDETADQIAAAVALGQWNSAEAFGVLFDFVSETQDVKVRSKAFDSLLRLGSQPFFLENTTKAKTDWSRLCDEAKLRSEKERVIRGLVNIDAGWTLDLIKSFTSDSSSSISTLAKKGIEHVNDRMKLKAN